MALNYSYLQGVAGTPAPPYLLGKSNPSGSRAEIFMCFLSQNLYTDLSIVISIYSRKVF